MLLRGGVYKDPWIIFKRDLPNKRHIHKTTEADMQKIKALHSFRCTANENIYIYYIGPSSPCFYSSTPVFVRTRKIVYKSSFAILSALLIRDKDRHYYVHGGRTILFLTKGHRLE